MMETRYFSIWHLTEAFIGEMIERDSGSIVVVGSSYVWMKSSHVAYKATHHALHGFAEALRHDLHDTGIRVTWVEPPALAPATAFFENNPGTRERLPRYFHRLTMRPERIARKIVRGIERGDWLVAPLTIRITRFLYLHAGMGRLIDRFNRAQMPPPSAGGPISGHRRALRNA